MKKISIFCAVVLMLCLISPASIAQNSYNLDQANALNKALELEEFEAYISVFFENYGQFAAIDFNGNDISAKFYNEYNALYKTKSFSALMNVANKQVAYLLQDDTLKREVDSGYGIDSSTVTHNVSNYRLFIANPPAPFSPQEYSTMLTSSFVENPINGQIVSARSPALTEYNNGGGTYPYEMSNVIIYSPIIVSNTVSFSAKFSLYKVIGGNRYYSGTFTHTDKYDSTGRLL